MCSNMPLMYHDEDVQALICLGNLLLGACCTLHTNALAPGRLPNPRPLPSPTPTLRCPAPEDQGAAAGAQNGVGAGQSLRETLQRLGVDGAVGAVVKASVRVALAAAGRV